MKRYRIILLWLTTLALVAGFALRFGQVQAKGNSENKAHGGGAEKSSGHTSRGLSTDDWKGIRQAYAAGNRRVFESEPGQWVTRNAAQGWKAEFNGRGARLDTGESRLGLNLERYGFSGEAAVVERKARLVTTVENRVEYVWDDRLTEWFVNDEKGLEQGWTLASAPDDATTLRLDVGVSGGLGARLVDDVSVALTDGNGATAMTYGGLKAWDATGRVLPARFEGVEGNRIRVMVETSGATFPVTVDPTVQQAYLKASNTDPFDSFGDSVAVSGDTVVVGASGESSNATGVNGNQADNSAPNSGAAYVFVRNGTTWSQQAYLKASNTGQSDFFGSKVAISGDTVVVGAFGESSNATGVNGDQADNSAGASGAAYVFVRNGTTWSQQAYLKASNTNVADQFGRSVGVSGDTVVVGASDEASNASGVNGDQSNNLAIQAGAAYVFFRNGTTWNQQAYLKASNTNAGDQFGRSIAISGDTVAVGALNEDSNATGVNGDESNNSASASGAGYIFVRDNSTWTQQAYLKASNTGSSDQFGFSIAVSGNTVVVGATGEDSNATGINGDQANNAASAAGAAYVFVRTVRNWSQQAYLKASNTNAADQFGWSVAVAGDTIVVGAIGEDSNATGVDGNQANNSASLAGAAYVLVRAGTTWSQQSYLKASNTNAGDAFGTSVAVAGDTVVIGANGEASNAIGVDGDQGDNSAGSSGAAYIFTIPLTCNYSLFSTSANFPATGGDGEVTLIATTGCPWNVSGVPAWITNVSPTNGTGTTPITYTVSPNLSETPRSATLTIGGLNYTVNQDPSVVVNGSLNLAITTSTVVTPTCTPSYANDYLIVASLTNVGSQTVFNPYFKLLELQSSTGAAPPVPFRLLTADGATCGSGGLVGAIQSADGQTAPATLPALAPGQSVTVRFVIALPSIRRFRFIVSAYGSFNSIIPATPANRHPGIRNFGKPVGSDPPPRMSFLFVPATDGKSIAVMPVSAGFEPFPNLGGDFRVGLNRTVSPKHHLHR